jgi:hypothetical protein
MEVLLPLTVPVKFEPFRLIARKRFSLYSRDSLARMAMARAANGFIE